MKRLWRISTNDTAALLFQISTAILLIGLLGGGLTQLLRIDYQTQNFARLGYPPYLMTVIGAGKILAVLVLLLPRLPLLKVGAYVGSFIVAVCAFIAHVVAGDGLISLAPLVLLVVTLTACLTNPAIAFAPPSPRFEWAERA